MNKAFAAFPKIITLPPEKFPPGLFGASSVTITLAGGITTLLGPNGTGKTKVMTGMRDHLKDEYGASEVRFISAGRMGIIESYRSNISGANNPDPNTTHVGNFDQTQYRKASETVTGDFLALMQRSDLKLKVEARLQGLFNKTLKLTWTQNGLKIDFQSLNADAVAYGAGSEASGLTHLVAILAALYDDEIKFLLIDEPEVSLHPQLQAFVLNEIQHVAGNPDLQGKKCVIISTHSPSMLALKTIQNLTSIVFFRPDNQTPVQIDGANPIMTNALTGRLIQRLSETYKIAFFANNVLLLEGDSDDIVVNTLATIKSANFASTGVQVVPVDGKNNLKTADLLFTTIGKKTYMLGDLDVLDDNDASHYLDSQKNVVAALPGGFPTLVDLFNDFRADLDLLIVNHWADISTQAATQKCYKSGVSPHRERAVISYLTTNSLAVIGGLNNPAQWIGLKGKLESLLDIMDNHGLVLIRKGAIEDCYLDITITPGSRKPTKAAQESTYISSNYSVAVDASYADVIKAINKIKRAPLVDESALLREKLGSVLGALEAIPLDQLTDDNISKVINKTDADISSIFEIRKRDGGNPGLAIRVVSILFGAYNTSFEHELGQPLNLIAKLPSAV